MTVPWSEEASLLFAVLAKAVSDGMSRPFRKEIEGGEVYSDAEAREFLMGEAASTVFDLLGLNPTWVRELLQHHAFGDCSTTNK